MKAILEFNLPDDQDAYTLAQNGGKLYAVVWDALQFIREKLKYGHDFTTPDAALENVRQQILDHLEMRGINIDILVE